MAHSVVVSKEFKWYHFSDLEEADFAFIEKNFKFHPLDFDDLRDQDALPKLDTYKHYLFAIFTIPSFNAETQRVLRHNLAVFIAKDYIVTITRYNIPAVSRFLMRLKKSRRFKQEVCAKSTGYFLYHLLSVVFSDVKLILKELVRETNQVESSVYDEHTKVTTSRLGVVRRNILLMRHVIDPQRIVIQQIAQSKQPYVSNSLDLYFDDIRDTLDSIWVISDNLKNIIDGLFDVNEALLSHRTNEIIRLLTVISVLLMPPTLITGYYGMNTEGLPFASAPIVISIVIVASIFLFWVIIKLIDRK